MEKNKKEEVAEASALAIYGLPYVPPLSESPYLEDFDYKQNCLKAKNKKENERAEERGIN